MNVNWRLQVQFWDAGNNSMISEVEYPFTATSGGIYLNNGEALTDHYLKYQLPGHTVINTGLNHELTAAVKRIYIKYRVFVPGTTPAYTSDIANIINVVKGGVASMNQSQDFFRNMNSTLDPASWLPGGGNFLTWRPAPQQLLPTQWSWVYYLSTIPGQQKLDYAVQYLDGTSASIPGGNLENAQPSVPSYQYRAWCIPVGLPQLALDPDGKGVKRFAVNVRNTLTNVLYATRNYIVDARPYYDLVFLYYRNSVGGLESLAMRGDVELSGDTEKGEYEQSSATPANSDGQNPYYDSRLRPKWKLNTGYISRKEREGLLEVYNTTFAALLLNGQWCQLRIPPQKVEPYLLSDNLHNMSIEVETAATFHTLPRELFDITP